MAPYSAVARSSCPSPGRDIDGRNEYPPMQQYLIATVVGSLRRASLNRRLADAVERLAPAHFRFERLRIDDLPLYNQDDDASPAATVVRMKNAVRAAQGLLFITPEYNRSIPGVLKNVLDHGSRPYGESVWAGLSAGILGTSPSAIGTALAQQHLRTILACLDVPVLCLPEAYIQAQEALFDGDGNIGAGSRPFFTTWMRHYVTWVEAHAR